MSMKDWEINCLISAVVCTYNRGPYLAKTIESLLNQTLSRALYEIVMVDNASTDDTASIVKGYAHEGVRYVYEPKQGLSHSRNTGFRQSRGDVVAYIDDDATARPDWLERLLKAFSSDEKIVAAGGKINPVWEIEKPDWITPNLYTYFSCIDWSDTPYYLEKGRYLFGCNMAFKKQLLVDSGGFSTILGRIGNNLLSNEEWEVFKYIDQRGFKKYYDPEICVDHMVLKSRINWRWLKSRLYWQGVSNLYYDYFIGNFTKTQLLKKYSKEIVEFFSRELSKLFKGRGNTILLRLFIVRYAGACIHFGRICLGLTRRA
jgi:glycosyltransferase involved in cell wall biosynthesis